MKVTHQEKIEAILKVARSDAEKGYTALKEGETVDAYIEDLREALSHLNAVEINQNYAVMGCAE